MSTQVRVHAPVRWFHKPVGERRILQHVLRLEPHPLHSDYLYALCGAEMSATYGGVKTGRMKVSIGAIADVECCPKCDRLMMKGHRRALYR